MTRVSVFQWWSFPPTHTRNNENVITGSLLLLTLLIPTIGWFHSLTVLLQLIINLNIPRNKWLFTHEMKCLVNASRFGTTLSNRGGSRRSDTEICAERSHILEGVDRVDAASRRGLEILDFSPCWRLPVLFQSGRNVPRTVWVLLLNAFVRLTFYFVHI